MGEGSAWRERGRVQVLIGLFTSFPSLLCDLTIWGRGSETLLAPGSGDGLLLSEPFLPQWSCHVHSLTAFTPRAGRRHWPSNHCPGRASAENGKCPCFLGGCKRPGEPAKQLGHCCCTVTLWGSAATGVKETWHTQISLCCWGVSVLASVTALIKNQKRSHRLHHGLHHPCATSHLLWSLWEDAALGGRVKLHWRGREGRQNGHCVAGALIAEGFRKCRGIVNESDEKLLF